MWISVLVFHAVVYCKACMCVFCDIQIFGWHERDILYPYLILFHFLCCQRLITQRLIVYFSIDDEEEELKTDAPSAGYPSPAKFTAQSMSWLTLCYEYHSPHSFVVSQNLRSAKFVNKISQYFLNFIVSQFPLLISYVNSMCGEWRQYITRCGTQLAQAKHIQ